MKLSDFVRLPASISKQKNAARWYYNPETKQQISRWQYQTLQNEGINPLKKSLLKKEMGVRDVAQKRATGQSHLVDTYKKKTAEKLGIKKSAVRVRGQSSGAVEFRANIKKIKAFNARMKKKKTKSYMYTPAEEHELSTLLVNLNFRDEDSPYPAGQSPTPEKTTA